MKKWIASVIISLTLITTASLTVHAQEHIQEQDGPAVILDMMETQVRTIIVEDRTWVHMEDIEALGFMIGKIQETAPPTVWISGILSEEISIGVIEIGEQGAYYLPLREIAEHFKYHVSFDEETRTVRLYRPQIHDSVGAVGKTRKIEGVY